MYVCEEHAKEFGQSGRSSVRAPTADPAEEAKTKETEALAEAEPQAVPKTISDCCIHGCGHLLGRPAQNRETGPVPCGAVRGNQSTHQ